MIGGEYLTPYIATLAPIIGLAFSAAVRDEIIARAGNRSEVSGRKAKRTRLHAMHLDHTKDETYDTPERGKLVTPMEHLIYHRVHRGEADKIGLTEDENEGAINLLLRSVRQDEG